MISSDAVIHSFRKIKNFSKPKAAICESYGCNNKSTASIIVDVGRLGKIDLNICNNCIPKFTDSTVNENNNGELTVCPEQLTPTDRTASPNDSYSKPYL